MAAGLHDASLMEGQRTEAASAEASAVADQAEFYFRDRWNTTRCIVTRMPGSHVWKCVDIVHLFLGQWFRRRILDHIKAVAVRLNEAFSRKWIGVAVLGVKALRIRLFIGGNLAVRRQTDFVVNRIQVFRLINSSLDEGDILCLDAARQCIRDLHDRALAHSVGNQICLGIQQNGAFHFSGPVIIMCQTPQAGFDTAEDDRLFRPGADQVGIDDRRIIRTFSHLAARCVGILCAALFRNRIMVYHRVHISGAHKPSETRFAQNLNGFLILPVRLGDDAYFIAVRFKHTTDDRVAERRVIDIRIPAHVDKIAALPAALVHIRPADR